MVGDRQDAGTLAADQERGEVVVDLGGAHRRPAGSDRVGAGESCPVVHPMPGVQVGETNGHCPRFCAMSSRVKSWRRLVLGDHCPAGSCEPGSSEPTTCTT